MTAVLLVRHAPPAVQGLCYGQHDVDVVGTHDEAARTVHEALVLRRAQPGLIFASPWARAHDLAAALARTMGTTSVRVDPRLSELSFGEWEGRSWEDLRLHDGERLDAWMANYVTARPPGGETTSDLDARIRAFVGALGEIEGTPVIVSHAGPIRAFRRLAHGTSWEEELARPVPFLGVEEVTLRATT